MNNEQMKNAVLQMEFERLQGDNAYLWSFLNWAYRDFTPDQIKSEFEEALALGYISEGAEQ